eukprot:Skav219418  [mRNA]  locus=scaffold4133:42730:43008:+ [translate_table: standard]
MMSSKRSHPNSMLQGILREFFLYTFQRSTGQSSRQFLPSRKPRIAEMLHEADEEGMLGDVTLPNDGYGYYHTVESVHMRPGATGGALLSGKG